MVAAARGDGAVDVFDADAQPSSSSSGGGSSASASSRTAKHGKGGGSNAARGMADGAGSSRDAISLSVRVAEGRGLMEKSWRGNLMLDRARGGHTRPATSVCFLGGLEEGDSSSKGGGKGKAGGAALGAPSHLLSASEDKRLLLWQLPLLGQVQGAGTEWMPRCNAEGSEQGGGVTEVEGGGKGQRDEAVQGGSASAGSQCLAAEHMHGRKVNCLHVPWHFQPPSHSPPSHCRLAFVGDTSKRLTCYAVDIG